MPNARAVLSSVGFDQVAEGCGDRNLAHTGTRLRLDALPRLVPPRRTWMTPFARSTSDQRERAARRAGARRTSPSPTTRGQGQGRRSVAAASIGSATRSRDDRDGAQFEAGGWVDRDLAACECAPAHRAQRKQGVTNRRRTETRFVQIVNDRLDVLALSSLSFARAKVWIDAITQRLLVAAQHRRLVLVARAVADGSGLRVTDPLVPDLPDRRRFRRPEHAAAQIRPGVVPPCPGRARRGEGFLDLAPVALAPHRRAVEGPQSQGPPRRTRQRRA